MVPVNQKLIIKNNNDNINKYIIISVNITGN